MRGFTDFDMYMILYMYIYIFFMYILYGHHPPGPIRALGAGVIILDNYIINMITCSKTFQIPVKMHPECI